MTAMRRIRTTRDEQVLATTGDTIVSGEHWWRLFAWLENYSINKVEKRTKSIILKSYYLPTIIKNRYTVTLLTLCYLFFYWDILLIPPRNLKSTTEAHQTTHTPARLEAELGHTLDEFSFRVKGISNNQNVCFTKYFFTFNNTILINCLHWLMVLKR